MELREYDDSSIILIYNHSLLEKYINTESNKEFLVSLGYSESGTVIEHLGMLRNRYKEYNCPHELGVFFFIESLKDKYYNNLIDEATF